MLVLLFTTKQPFCFIDFLLTLLINDHKSSLDSNTSVCCDFWHHEYAQNGTENRWLFICVL